MPTLPMFDQSSFSGAGVGKKKGLILVTSATGNQGNAVARLLLEKAFRVRVMTQSPQSAKSKLLAGLGAEIVLGDLDNPASLYSALNGAAAVFAMQSSRAAESQLEETRGKRLAYLAKEQGIEQYVYSSVASARDKSGIPHFEVKGRIEQTIRDLKFKSYTFLRGTFFMESLLDRTIFPEIISSGQLICPIKPAIKVQMVSAEDLAKFALYSFEHPEIMHGLELDLAGDEHTFSEIANVLSTVFSKRIEFASIEMDDFARMRNFSNELRYNVESIIAWWEALGWNVDIGGLMLASRNFGIEMKTLKEWAQVQATRYDATHQTCDETGSPVDVADDKRIAIAIQNERLFVTNS